MLFKVPESILGAWKAEKGFSPIQYQPLLSRARGIQENRGEYKQPKAEDNVAFARINRKNRPQEEGRQRRTRNKPSEAVGKDHYMHKRGSSEFVASFPSIRKKKTLRLQKKPDPLPISFHLPPLCKRSLGAVVSQTTKKSERRGGSIEKRRSQHSPIALADFNPLRERTEDVVEAICKLILMSRLQTPLGNSFRSSCSFPSPSLSSSSS